MIKGRTLQISVLGVILLLVVACALPKNAPPATQPPPTGVAASPTPAAPTVLAATLTPASPTETSAPPTAAPPKATSVPPAAPPPPLAPLVDTSGAVRLKFAAGATSTYISTGINSGEVKKYLVNAMQGQLLMLMLDSNGSDVVLDLSGVSDGVKMAKNVDTWKTWLPRTQDYLITVKPKGGSTNFTLDVSVPANIAFAAGAVSKTVDGHVLDHAVNSYLAMANKNQQMTVKITSPGGDVLLTIYGLDDGSPLVRSVSGATSWTGKLPATQNYVIQAVSVGGSTDYTLKVTIK